MDKNNDQKHNLRDDINGIFKIYDEAKNRILLCLESSVPPWQFKILRKVVLDELGNSGAQGRVRVLLLKENGQASSETGKGGGVYE